MKTRSLVAFLLIALCHIAGADELVFFDDFDDGILGDNWVISNEGLDVFQGRVRSTQNGRFIITRQEFTGTVRVEFELEKAGVRNHGGWDFAIELTASPEQSGIIRFDTFDVDGVAIGPGPSLGPAYGDAVTIGAASTNRGTAALAYTDSVISFAFQSEEENLLDAGSEFVGDLDSFQIKIHLAAYADSPRFVDNVKIYSLASLGADFDGDGDVDGDDFIRWQIGFGDFPNGGAQRSNGDYDSDGDVDGDDFLGWQAEFGGGGNGAVVAVPERSTLIMLALGSLAVAVIGKLHSSRASNPGRRDR